jgi:hypothetical protein
MIYLTVFCFQRFEGLVMSNGGVVVLPFSEKTPSYIQKIANSILSVLSQVQFSNPSQLTALQVFDYFQLPTSVSNFTVSIFPPWQI